MKSYPKKRIRLKGAALKRLREQVMKADAFRCVNPDCCSCAPPEALQMHHVESKGASGSDTIDNCFMLCDACHRAVQTYEIELDWGEINEKRR